MNKQCYNYKSRTCTFCIGVPFVSFCVNAKLDTSLSSRTNNLLELLFPQSCESSMMSFTVANREAAFLPCGPIEGYEECLSVTGEGGWLKKSGWKRPETGGSPSWWQNYAEEKHRVCGYSRNFPRLLPRGCDQEPTVEGEKVEQQQLSTEGVA